MARLALAACRGGPGPPKSRCTVVPARRETRHGPTPAGSSRPVAAGAAQPPHLAELDRLGDQIAELSAHLEAATSRLLDLIREFDARRGWQHGFRSCAEWLAWRVSLDLGAARERVRVARALGTLPTLAEALARGELSYAKVRALTRIATPETEARQHAGRALHVHQEEGTVMLRGRLTPEAGALLLRALDAARETLYQRRRADEAVRPATDPAAEAPTRPQQQADALALLAETALHQELDPGAPGERYQVVVHVDAAGLTDPAQPGQSVLEEGTRVPAKTSRRLARDASRVVMRHDADGRVVEVGARTRTIPPALRRVLQHRDKTCRFPGCNDSAAGIIGRYTKRARTGLAQWHGERLDVRWAIDVLHPRARREMGPSPHPDGPGS